MKRIILALLAGGTVFGIVWGAAANLNVGGGTAATGQGNIDPCGDITGSTYILESQSVVTFGDDIVGNLGNVGPADITEFKAVNIETSADCNLINAFIEVRNGSNVTIASGTCQMSGDGTPGSGPEDDGLGYDELSPADNVPGCTISVGIDTTGPDDLPNVADAEFLVVTET